MTAISDTSTGNTTNVALIVGVAVAALALLLLAVWAPFNSQVGDGSTNSVSSYTTDIQDASGASAYLDNPEEQH